MKQIKAKLYDLFNKIETALAKESAQNIRMLTTYRDYIKGKSTKRQMKSANLQFRELLKSLNLGIFAVLPLAPITIPFIVYIGKRLHVDVLPKWFKEK